MNGCTKFIARYIARASTLQPGRAPDCDDIKVSSQKKKRKKVGSMPVRPHASNSAAKLDTVDSFRLCTYAWPHWEGKWCEVAMGYCASLHLAGEKFGGEIGRIGNGRE